MKNQWKIKSINRNWWLQDRPLASENSLPKHYSGMRTRALSATSQAIPPPRSTILPLSWQFSNLKLVKRGGWLISKLFSVCCSNVDFGNWLRDLL